MRSIITLIKNKISKERGSSLIQSLVSMVIISVISIGVSSSLVSSYAVTNKVLRKTLAKQIAEESIEIFNLMNPEDIDYGDAYTNESVNRNNLSFNKTASIIINSNGSRKVTILVNSADQKFTASHEVAQNFPLRGLR